VTGGALTAIPRIDLADFEAGGQRCENFIGTTMLGLHDTGFVFLKTHDGGEEIRTKPNLSHVFCIQTFCCHWKQALSHLE